MEKTKHIIIPVGCNALSIDHIAIPAAVKVICQCAVIDREALDSSDHSPVYADVEF